MLAGAAAIELLHRAAECESFLIVALGGTSVTVSILQEGTNGGAGRFKWLAQAMFFLIKQGPCKVKQAPSIPGGNMVAAIEVTCSLFKEPKWVTMCYWCPYPLSVLQMPCLHSPGHVSWCVVMAPTMPGRPAFPGPAVRA